MKLQLINGTSDIDKLYSGWSSFETYLVYSNILLDSAVKRHCGNLAYLLPTDKAIDELVRVFDKLKGSMPDKTLLRVNRDQVNWLEVLTKLRGGL